MSDKSSDITFKQLNAFDGVHIEPLLRRKLRHMGTIKPNPHPEGLFFPFGQPLFSPTRNFVIRHLIVAQETRPNPANDALENC